jgi:FkbM family methyltransferase
VSQPVAYVARDASPRRHTAEYDLRGLRMRVTHGTEDTAIFQEIFTCGYYDMLPEFPPPRRVADIGGNIGMFALQTAIRWPQAEIIAFEPDPKNAAKYRWTMRRNSIPGRLIVACAASRDGTAMFSPGRESTSRLTGDGSGVPVPTIDAFPHLAEVELIKMDIEGGEWDLLLDERFATLPARAVLMEYHPHLCPGDDPRALAEATLRAAGYYHVEPVCHAATGVGMLRAFR